MNGLVSDYRHQTTVLKILRLSEGVAASARPAPLSEHDEGFGKGDLMLLCKVS